MKVSVNWVKQFVDFELPPIDELVTKIGAQLGAVEEVVDLGARYQDIRVVKVVSCDKHPNADKLSVCAIDDGGNTPDVKRDAKGLVQVVCGAPNVREGMLAAWLPPGVTVPSTIDKDPFVLEARELRGVVSNGMLASPKELTIGDSHEGLLEIDKEARPGDDFAALFKLDDHIIDIENKMFTHRPDCFGALGVAREIAGILHQPFKSPEWYTTEITLPEARGEELPLAVTNELPESVPRFTAITMRDVKIGPSPVWLQVALSKVGQKPVNNIVDLTNFYMLVTGQPLHAYDYDKVKALSDGDQAALVIRNPKPGEKIKLLNGKEIEPRAEAIMIATDKQLIGVGGVMGGTETEVDDHTKNIILECANFDMYSIRRTSMAHGLFTDAVTRFTKGQSPLQCLTVAAKTIADIQKLAGGEVAGPVIDNKHLTERSLTDHTLHVSVQVSKEFINERLGLSLDDKQIIQLLENVEFHAHTKLEEICVSAPFWRTDIELREDIVEEVGRLYGYDHLPLTLPKRDLTPARRDPAFAMKSKLRDVLRRAGANELLTYSFVHGDLIDKVRQDKSRAFQISNALSPDLQYYRLSLTPSLLERIHPNIKAGYDEFALFEIGRVHSTDEIDQDGLPMEYDRLSLVFAANTKAATARHAGAAYYEAKKFADKIFDDARGMYKLVPLKEADLNQHQFTRQMTLPYEPNRSTLLHDGQKYIGVIGEYRSSVQKALKLPKYCAGLEIFFSEIPDVQPGYTPLLKFPGVRQDITLRVPADLPYMQLYESVGKSLGEHAPVNSHIKLDEEPIDVYQKEDDKSHKQVTFRITVTGLERTLTDKEVNAILDAIAEAAQTEYGAERV